MAGYEKISDIVDSKAFKQVADLTAQLTQLDKLMQTLIADGLKLSKEGIGGNVKVTQEKKRATEQLTEVEKVRIKVEKDAAKAEAQYQVTQEKFTGSLKSLRTERTKMIRELDALNLKTKEGQQAEAKYRAEIDRLTHTINKHSDSVTRQRHNIGNYQSALSGMGTKTLGVASALGGMGTKILGVASALGVAVGGMAIFKGVIESTEYLSDKFKETLGGLHGVVGHLFKRIATGNFENLIEGMKAAWKEGQRYAESLDNISEKRLALEVKAKKIEDQILEQRTIAVNRENKYTLTERQKALDEAVRLMKVKALMMKTIEIESLDTELTNVAQKTKHTKEYVAFFVSNYDTLFGKIKEGQKLQGDLEEMRKNAQYTTLDEKGRATQKTNISLMGEYKKAIEGLTQEQKANIEWGKMDNLMLYDKRVAIRNAIIAVIDQDIAIKEFNFSQTRLRGRLYNEWIKGEKEMTVAAEKEAKERTSLEKMYTDSIIDEQQRELAALKDKYDADVLLTEGNADLLLDIFKKYMYDRGAIVQKYWDEQAKVTEAAQEKARKAQEEKDKAAKEGNDKLTQEWADKWQQAADDIVTIEDEKTKALKKIYEELEQAGIDILTNFISAGFENQIGAMNEQLDTWHQKKLDDLEDQKDKGLLTEKQYQTGKDRIEAQYETKRKAARIKEAQLKKQEALFEIAINTAVAIAKAAPNVFAMALAGAAGAAQAAIVVAQPIPKYARGRRGGPGEFAVVGEAGAEVVDIPGQGAHLVKDRMITYLPAGASVIPNAELMAMATGHLPRVQADRAGWSLDRVVQAEDQAAGRIVRAIEGRAETRINITREGMFMIVRDQAGWQRWVNQNIKR